MSSVSAFSLEIKGAFYHVSTSIVGGNRTVSLERTLGESFPYLVAETPTRTVCDCPDYQYRHAQLDYSEGCKHIQALVDAGIIRNIQPWEATLGSKTTNSEGKTVVS